MVIWRRLGGHTFQNVERCQTAGPIGTKFGARVWEWTLTKINPLIPEWHGGSWGHQFINLGKLLNHWTDRDQIRHTYADSSGNRHWLNKLTYLAPRGIWRGLKGPHIQKDVRKMPKSWTDRSHVWHTYAYLSGNGHELKIKPLIPEGHGGLWGHQLINLGKLPNHWTDRDQI